MTQIILIIIGIAIIVVLFSRKSREKIVGICAAAIGQDVKKRENKEKILTEMSRAGYTLASDLDLLPEQNFLIFQ